MPRQPKPFFRKQTQSWYFSTRGKQHNLGKDKAAAFEKFYQLMAAAEPVTTQSFTVYELSQSYLDWVHTHRAIGTYRLQKHYLKSFIEFAGKKLKVADLKAACVRRWVSGKVDWNSTTQSDGIGAVQRMLNWAVENEYLSANPVRGFKKPRRKRRDTVYTADQWRQIKSHTDADFAAFLDFLYLTGCRPREARTLETRHIHNDNIIFPGDESKGEMTRVIFLIPQTRQIVKRFAKRQPHGPIFRNAKGNPWTKDAIKCRLNRISKKVGFRVIAYGARHSFATNALINEVDPISVAHLMGHRNPKMVAEVYSHLANNTAFLKRQAAKCIGNQDDAA